MDEIKIKKLIQKTLYKYGKCYHSDTRHFEKDKISELSFLNSILELIQLVKEMNEVVEDG